MFVVTGTIDNGNVGNKNKMDLTTSVNCSFKVDSVHIKQMYFTYVMQMYSYRLHFEHSIITANSVIEHQLGDAFESNEAGQATFYLKQVCDTCS